MEKLTLNNVEFNWFGTNNYSNGMELVTVTNPSKDLVQRVLNKEIFGTWASPTPSKAVKFTKKFVFLNPSAPCGDFEFFGVLGTEEQYNKFYKTQVDAQIANAMIEKFGWSDWPEREITKAYEAELRKNYKDWWEK